MKRVILESPYAGDVATKNNIPVEIRKILQ